MLAIQACADSSVSSQRLLLALCSLVCGEKNISGVNNSTSTGGTNNGNIIDHKQDVAKLGPSSDPSLQPQASPEPAEEGGFSPILLSPRSFSALARLLRASLDQAAISREFLQARNCLVISALFAVGGAEYVSWLREAKTKGGSSGGKDGGDTLAVMADSELVSAAGALDRRQQQQPGTILPGDFWT